MHSTPPPRGNTPEPAADPPRERSSVVALASAPLPVDPPPGTTDHVPTILGENPLAPSQPPVFDLPAGSLLGHFEVIGPLGSGGMATVFRAKDTTLGREVALKILPPAFANDPDAVSRFKFEARAAAKLNHDHVARVFFIGEDRGLHFIAFEYVDGRTLRELIDAQGPLSAADAVRYLLDVAVGLQHAAGKGVVHRDVKPSNIIITPGGRAKLIDMGLARSLDPQSVYGGVTQSGMTLGTFDYISPEQALDPRQADVRADIYSLGCTFYHALTGRTPVPDGNAARKLAAHQTEAPTDPRLINPNIPDDLAAVLDRMMAKKPDHRHQTADDLIADLNRVAVSLGVTEAASDQTANTPAHVPTVGRSRAGVVSLAVGGLAVAIVAVVLVLAGGGRRVGPPAVPWAGPPPAPPLSSEPFILDPLPVRTVPLVQNAATTADLLQALRDGVPRVVLTGREYDLAGETGIVATGKTVEIEGPPDGGAVLRVVAGGRGEVRPGTISFRGCDAVRLKGLRVEVSNVGDTSRPVGVSFHDVRAVDLSECRFTLSAVGTTDGTLLAFSGPSVLVVRHGFFATAKGWAAVELPGGTKAEFSECGFVTSRSAVEVTPAADGPASVTTSHVTFLLNGSAAAVSVGRGGRCEFTAGHTLFAAPTDAGMMPEMANRAGVLRSPDPADLSRLVIPDNAPSAAYRVDPPTNGASPVLLSGSPWAGVKETPANPFALLELNPKLPLLRAGEKKADILGVREWSAQIKIYPVLPPLDRPGEVIWDPKYDDTRGDGTGRVYADLGLAVASLKGRGTVRVHSTGPTPMPVVLLSETSKAITFRPDDDCTPELIPAANSARRDTALFRLEGGELLLEDLKFAVKPGKAEAVVAMNGGKRCGFKRCVVTLDETSEQPSAVVSLADVRELMRKEQVFPDRPDVTFEDCFVRGRGRVLRAGVAGPATVTLNNVGVALDGPAFDLGPAAVLVQMTHVTVALGGPLLDVKAARRPFDDKPPAVKVEVLADNCLFVPLDKALEPLLRVAALDPTSADRPLTWTTTGGNAFGPWSRFVEVTDAAGDTKRWDAADWQKWSQETGTDPGKLRRLLTAKAVSAARPSDLEPVADITAGLKPKPLAPLFPE